MAPNSNRGKAIMEARGFGGSCDYFVKSPDHQPLQLVPHHVGSSSSSGIDVDGRQVGKKGSSKPKASKRKNDCQHPQGEKKPRLIWTPELHQCFVEIYNRIPSTKIFPKQILEQMEGKYPFVTRENIASHLQKHRLNTKIQAENSAKASSKSVPLKIAKESKSQSIHPKTSNANSKNLLQSHPNSTNPISSQLLPQSHPNSTNPISSQVLLQSHPNSTNPISSQVLLQSHPNSTNPISSQLLLQSHPNSTNPISSQLLLQSHPNSTNPSFDGKAWVQNSQGCETWVQNSQGCGFKLRRKQFEFGQFHGCLKRSRNYQVHYQEQQPSFNNNVERGSYIYSKMTNVCENQENPNWALPIGQSSIAPTNDLAVSTKVCPPPISANQISGNDGNGIGFNPIMDFNSFGGWNNTNNDPFLDIDLPNFAFWDYYDTNLNFDNVGHDSLNNDECHDSLNNDKCHDSLNNDKCYSGSYSEPLDFGYPLNFNTINGFQTDSEQGLQFNPMENDFTSQQYFDTYDHPLVSHTFDNLNGWNNNRISQGYEYLPSKGTVI